MRCVAFIAGKDFIVESFAGKEAVSDGYIFEVILRGLSTIELGDEIKLLLHDSTWIGLIDTIASCYFGDNEQYFYYKLTFTSYLQYYTRSSKYCLYENISFQDLLIQLVANIRYTLDVQVSRHYEYFVQYKESNFKVIQHILSSNGLYYYYDNDKLVITNSSTLDSQELLWNTIKSPEKIHNKVISMQVISEMQVKECTTFGFNIARPELPLKDFNQNKYGHFNETYYDTDILTNNQAKDRGQHRNNMNPTKYSLESHLPSIRAGSLVEIIGGIYSGSYFVTTVEHKYNQDNYINTIIMIKSDIRFFPIITSLNRVNGMQIATVVGPELNTREGKVQVKFNWENKTVAYIPILLGICDNGWGMTMIPRANQRVAVLFEDGDACRPMICGAFYDGSHLPPYPNNPYITGIKTKSFGSNRFNELAINDKPDNEAIIVKACNDIDEEIQRNKNIKVFSGDINTTVQNGNKNTYLLGQNTSHVLKIKSGQSLTQIENGQVEVNIDTGIVIIKVKTGSISLESPQVNVKSDQVILESSKAEIKTIEAKIESTYVDIVASGEIKLNSGKISLNSL